MRPALDELDGDGLIAQIAKRGLLATAAAATVGALALVTITFLIAKAATDSLLVTPPGGDAPEEVALGAVLFAALVGGVIGTGLAWATSRFVRRPRTTFLKLCAVGLVLYGIVPFTAADEVVTGVWLNLMHASVALPIVGGLSKYLPGTRT